MKQQDIIDEIEEKLSERESRIKMLHKEIGKLVDENLRLKRRIKSDVVALHNALAEIKKLNEMMGIAAGTTSSGWNKIADIVAKKANCQPMTDILRSLARISDKKGSW